MAAKTSWHRYGTKLCHCHLIYRDEHKNNFFFPLFLSHSLTEVRLLSPIFLAKIYAIIFDFTIFFEKMLICRYLYTVVYCLLYLA